VPHGGGCAADGVATTPATANSDNPKTIELIDMGNLAVTSSP
jgi:hypothetical protein